MRSPFRFGVISGMDTEALDKAVALFLMRPSSATALGVAREARKLSIRIDGPDGRLDGLTKDASDLFRSALIMEADPEIVKRNTLARVLAGLGPFLSAWEEVKTLEDRTWDEILISAGSVVSEVASSTQYLESARLTTHLHFREELYGIEDRMVKIAAEHGGDLERKIGRVEDFIDGIVRDTEDPKEKPVVLFSLRTVIMVISYRLVKENI